ncbi:hypothetical protein CEXT_177271 [Caerostris extrusa]|uniref:Uncharacterized protein n=1 Tax=Caerostris extrusa TaxID=172846 RepID=A0AAV4XBS2_CAEEX|nr:hypothetical protein CEXT_177271 [Caerostris extrusa]
MAFKHLISWRLPTDFNGADASIGLFSGSRDACATKERKAWKVVHIKGLRGVFRGHTEMFREEFLFNILRKASGRLIS